jgi:hypothetical protein
VFNKVISSLPEINLNWLQWIIDNNYAGNADKISNYTITSLASMTGHTALIQLSYDGAKSVQLPSSLFLKFCQSNDRFIKDSEYLYYKRDYDDLENSPLPVCYDAQFDAINGAYHVLLQDLSHTHYSNKGIKPTISHALSVATELARLHAFRWGKKALKLKIDTDAAPQISNFIAHVSNGLSPILKAIEKDVPHFWQATIKKVFDIHPALMKQRAKDITGQTLIHGDPNPSNVLSPHDPAEKTYIIDRQPFAWSLRYWLGVYDLAYMIVPFWEAEHRRTLEGPMLKKYHDSLIDFGVTDYSWEQCQKDYRLCIPHGLYVAIEWGGNENDVTRMKWLWEKQLHRSMDAFIDWKCDELLS